MPTTVFWLAPEGPSERLAALLAERGLRLALAAPEELSAERVRRCTGAVLCFGPGTSPTEVAAALALLAPVAPETPCLAVVLADAELGPFQQLLDDERLFYLSRRSLPDSDLAALLAAAVEEVERRTPGPRLSAPSDRLAGGDTLRQLALARTPQELAATLGAAAARAAGATRGRCVLFDRERQALWSPGTAPEAKESPAVGLVSFVLRTGPPLRLEAASEDPRFDPELDDPGGAPGDRFLAALARAGTGEPLAVLVAHRASGEPPFDAGDAAALETLAAQAAPYLKTLPQAAAPRPPAPRGPFRLRAVEALERSAAALEPLRLSTRWTRSFRRVPFVPQTAAADCGAACLAMSLAWHGRTVALDDVRRVTGLSLHGLDARTLLQAAQHFGLRGRGVQFGEPEDLALLEPGTILHWQFKHFVVLERATRDGAWIVDPASGRRFVPRADLDRALTGVALTLEPGPDFARGGAKIPLLRRYLSRVLRHDATLGRILAASLVLQVLTLALPLITGLLVDRVIPRGDRSLFWVLAAGAAMVVGFVLLTALVRGRILLALRTRLDSQLTLDFLDHLVHLPFPFFQQRSAGDLLMRLASNATIREILTSAVLSGALDGLMVVSYLALLLVADARLGLLVAALAAVRVAILVAALRRRRRLAAEALEAQAVSQSYQVQMLAGIEALKACGAEGRAVDAWSHLFTRELNVSLARGRLDALVNSLLDALALASPVAILLYGAARVMAGDLTLGTMLSLAALAAGFLAPLSALVANAAQFQLLGTYLQRLEDVLSAPREPDGLDRPQPAGFSGRVALDGVTFRYGPLVPPALDAATFAVEPGQLVAVVGRSGSGKSTLAGLVAGLLEPEAGQILYDGRPLAELPREWLRRNLAYVPQQSFLFGTSVRANIALQDPELPFERIVEAARLAEVHDEIVALPMGYETVLADGGASLSGGQRQRIALARALVAEPKVLILDEATSALDALTERKVQQNLARLRMTRLVAAHRLSTIRDADRILVLDQGRIVESGTHDELVAGAGLYARLVAAQLEQATSTRDADTPRVVFGAA